MEPWEIPTLTGYSAKTSPPDSLVAVYCWEMIQSGQFLTWNTMRPKCVKKMGVPNLANPQPPSLKTNTPTFNHTGKIIGLFSGNLFV